MEDQEISGKEKIQPEESKRRSRPFLTVIAFITLAAGGMALAWIAVFLAQKLQNQSVTKPAEIRYLGKDDSAVFPVEIIDSLGRSTIWTESPSRIVSLAPSLTSMVTFWEKDSKVVGVTRYCQWRPDQRPVKKIGGMTDPNLEVIHTLQPDLILASTLTPATTLNALDSQFGKQLVVFSHSGWQGVEKDNQAVAALLGIRTKANPVGIQWKQREQLLRRKSNSIPVEQRQTLLLLYGTQGLYTCGPGSFAHDLIQLAGLKNVTRKENFEWAQVSIESVLLWNPDWILVTDEHQGESAPTAETLEERKQKWMEDKSENDVWKQLSAIQQNKVIWTVDPGWTTPGPGSLKTAELLHDTIY